MARESIFAEWKRSAFGGFLNIAEYWKQRRLVLREPSLIFDDPSSQLSIQPLAFALRGLLLLAIVFSLVAWAFETFSQLPPTPIDRAIASSKELEQKIANRQLELQDLLKVGRMASSRDLIAAKKVQAFFETLRGLVLPIGLTLTAYLFRRRFAKYADLAQKVKDADRAYLYWVTAHLFWPNVALVAGIQVVQFVARFDVFADAPDLPDVIAIWLTVICGIWGLVVLRRAASGLSRILELDELLGAPQALRRTANNLVLSAVLTNIAIFMLMNGIVSAYATGVAPTTGYERSGT